MCSPQSKALSPTKVLHGAGCEGLPYPLCSSDSPVLSGFPMELHSEVSDKGQRSFSFSVLSFVFYRSALGRTVHSPECAGQALYSELYSHPALPFSALSASWSLISVILERFSNLLLLPSHVTSADRLSVISPPFPQEL